MLLSSGVFSTGQPRATFVARLSAALAICLAAAMLGRPALAKTDKNASRALRYAGVLQDENQAPVGGVYRLEFSLYVSKQAEKSSWSETHWVAVDNGKYVVQLGEQTPLPTKLQLDKAFIGVGIPGIGEILRERLIVEARGDAPVDAPVDAAPPPSPHGTASPQPQPGGVVEYAEKSGFAYEAELASNSHKLEGMTMEDLKRALVRPPKIGASTQDTPAAGGKGGYAFEYSCPKGYVVTGMKGAAGLYVDSLQLICSPLE